MPDTDVPSGWEQIPQYFPNVRGVAIHDDLRQCGHVATQCRLLCLFNFANFDLSATSLNGLLTGASGQINGTTALGHNIDRVGVGTGVYSLGAPRQIEFGLRLLTGG